MPKMPIKSGPKLDIGTKTFLQGILNKAMMLHNQGDLHQAAKEYQRIISVSPRHFDATHLLAVAIAQLGNHNKARELFARALALHPGHAEVHFNKGTMEEAAGRLAEAVADFSLALEAAPDHARALNNRSLALQAMRKFDDAMSDSDRLTELVSGDPTVWNNRATLLHDMMRLDEALVCFDKALRLKPDYVEALNNRGNVLKDLHRFDKAIADYDSAIAMDPDFAGAPFNKSLAQLLLGDYENGFRLWEWRWRQPNLTSPKRNFEQPLWLGQSDVAGRKILLHSEQGLGDTIQFIRYAPMVANLGAKVIVEAPASLHPLLAELPGMDKLVGKGETLPAFDLHCPLMSLPLAFGTTIKTIPASAPYLTISSNRIQVWSKRLGASVKPRVALAWRGNPKNSNDRNRSADLADISSYLSPQFDWLCLHHDLTDPEMELAGSISHLKTPLDGDTGLEDAAAICAISDAVVTVDTSFAHIAGALGKTSFVLLPYTPDWRWLMNRSDSPWYPTMTLFRQATACDWNPVMQDVSATLKKLIGNEAQ